MYNLVYKYTMYKPTTLVSPLILAYNKQLEG